MWLKNNSSKNSWLQYDCGSCKIDILPEAIFEVNDAIGKIILKNIGAPNWITQTEAPKKEIKEVKEVKKVFKK
jgi:hypothetical protein